MKTFRETFPSLKEEVLRGLSDGGFEVPAEVQKVLLPFGLRGEHVVVQGASGSGKTVCFAILCLQTVDANFVHESNHLSKLLGFEALPQRLQCLILCPTREIALQVSSEFTKIGFFLLKERKLTIIACVGGTPLQNDHLAMRLRLPHIIIATPGRLLSLLQDESSVSAKKLASAARLVSRSGDRGTEAKPSTHDPTHAFEAAGMPVSTSPAASLETEDTALDDEAGPVESIDSVMEESPAEMLVPVDAAPLDKDPNPRLRKPQPLPLRRKRRRVIEQCRWEIPPLKLLVFEEADRLLSEDFQRQTIAVVTYAPKGSRTQSVFLSATYPPNILHVTEELVYTINGGTASTETQSIEEQDSVDDELCIIVNGSGVDPPAHLQPHQILRKCFLVSSFIMFNEALESEVRLPISFNDAGAPAQSITIASPALANVECSCITVPEASPTDCSSLCEVIADKFKLGDAVNIIEGDENVDAPKRLLQVADWLLEEDAWGRWDDLVPKFLVLLAVLWSNPGAQCFVFCNDHISAALFAETLRCMGVMAGVVTGNVYQAQRREVIQQFREARLQVVMCSDVLARGLDVPNANLVLCLDLPLEKETILHRIGRAGRYGREGRCLFVCTQTEHSSIKYFQAQAGFQLRTLVDVSTMESH